jgi:hypothetical protein
MINQLTGLSTTVVVIVPLVSNSAQAASQRL